MPAARGNNSSNSSSPKVGKPKLGSPFGISPVTATPSAGSPKHCRNEDGQDDNGKPNRSSRQEPCTKQQQRDRCKPDRQHDPVNAAELSDKRDQAIEEIMTAAGNAEQARQLRHDDGQPRAGLEADQDAVADQPHQHAEPEEPGDQAKSRDGKGSNTRNLGVADRIARREALRPKPRSSARSPRSGRPQAGATSRAAHSRCRPAYSRRRRPAAAGRRAPHRPATPGSRKPQASRRQ